MKVRIGDAEYSSPFRTEGGRWMVTVAYDDGDRFVTAASRKVLAAFFDAFVTAIDFDTAEALGLDGTLRGGQPQRPAPKLQAALEASLERPEEHVRVIDLFRVAELVREGGTEAVCESTGGNCATVLAGPIDMDEHGNDLLTVLCGPGWFDGPDKAFAPASDLSIGLDDDGGSRTVQVPADATEEQIATMILDAVRAELKD